GVGHVALQARRSCPAAHSASTGGGLARSRVPRATGLPGQPWRRGGRATGPPAGERSAEGLPDRGARRRGAQGRAAGVAGGRDPDAGARSSRALAARPRAAELAALHVPGRCAARGTTGPRGPGAEGTACRGLGALDASAIEQVVADARPLIRDAEELHDWLLAAVVVPAEGMPGHLVAELVGTGRATRLTVSTMDGSGARNEVFGTSVREFIVCAERLLHARALFPDAVLTPALAPLAGGVPRDREVWRPWGGGVGS